MEQILTVNLIGNVRREKLHGRDYLVANSTILVSGVLDGSKGPLFYPPDEVAKEPYKWNHIPIVLYHPVINSIPVSGRDPVILESSWMGNVYNASVKSNKTSNGNKLSAEDIVKLQVQLWFEEEATLRIDPRVHYALNTGKQLELSTGLGTDNELAPPNSTYKGIPYSYIARNYRPDHLAILPDQIGACAIKDGCGVLVNSLPETQSTPSNIAYSLPNVIPNKVTETSKESVQDMNKAQLVDWIVANCDCWKQPTDKETLMTFTDEKLSSMKAAIEKNSKDSVVANAATKGFTQNGTTFKFDTVTNQWSSITQPIPQTIVHTPQPTVNQVPQTSQVQQTPVTVSQWMATAPPEVQSAVQNAMVIEQREKGTLISRITANVQEGDPKKRLIERLSQLKLAELHDYLALAPTQQSSVNNGGTGSHTPFQNIILPGDSPFTSVSNSSQYQVDENDTLVPLVVNWEDEVKLLARAND